MPSAQLYSLEMCKLICVVTLVIFGEKRLRKKAILCDLPYGTFFPSIWNALHDGGIERIVGSVPGDLRVFVAIEYLRERFADEGDELLSAAEAYWEQWVSNAKRDY